MSCEGTGGAVGIVLLHDGVDEAVTGDSLVNGLPIMLANFPAFNTSHELFLKRNN